MLALSIYTFLSFPEVHPVAAYIFFLVFPSLLSFPSITCFRRQFLRLMWPIQLAFLLFFLFVRYSTLPWHLATLLISHMVRPTALLRPSPVPHFKTFQLSLIHSPKCPSSSTIQSCISKCRFRPFYSLCLSPICLWKEPSCVMLLWTWHSSIKFHVYILRSLLSCRSTTIGKSYEQPLNETKPESNWR